MWSGSLMVYDHLTLMVIANVVGLLSTRKGGSGGHCTTPNTLGALSLLIVLALNRICFPVLKALKWCAAPQVPLCWACLWSPPVPCVGVKYSTVVIMPNTAWHTPTSEGPPWRRTGTRVAFGRRGGRVGVEWTLENALGFTGSHHWLATPLPPTHHAKMSNRMTSIKRFEDVFVKLWWMWLAVIRTYINTACIQHIHTSFFAQTSSFNKFIFK